MATHLGVDEIPASPVHSPGRGSINESHIYIYIIWLRNGASLHYLGTIRGDIRQLACCKYAPIGISDEAHAPKHLIQCTTQLRSVIRAPIRPPFGTSCLLQRILVALFLHSIPEPGSLQSAYSSIPM